MEKVVEKRGRRRGKWGRRLGWEERLGGGREK